MAAAPCGARRGCLTGFFGTGKTSLSRTRIAWQPAPFRFRPDLAMKLSAGLRFETPRPALRKWRAGTEPSSSSWRLLTADVTDRRPLHLPGGRLVSVMSASMGAVRSSAQGSASPARAERQANSAGVTVRCSGMPATPCLRSARIIGAIKRFTSSTRLAVPLDGRTGCRSPAAVSADVALRDISEIVWLIRAPNATVSAGAGPGGTEGDRPRGARCWCGDLSLSDS